MTYPVLLDEDERLHALAALQLLDSPQEERFDRITRVVQTTLDVPIALVSLVDVDRQWFKSCQGLSVRETPRSASFCAHAIADDAIFVVPDALRDPRFADNPLVLGDPFIRFYAGKPIHAPSGVRIGTLCAIDRVPQQLDPRRRALLEDLAAWTETEVGLVRMSQAAGELDRLRREVASILNAASEGICSMDTSGVLTLANPAAEAMTGWGEHGLVGRRAHATLHGRRADGSRFPDHECPLMDVVQTGQPTAVEHDVFWRRDGSSIQVAYSAAPLFENGVVTGAVVVFRDISERLQVDRLKDEFISVVSHELRTPLTAVRGALGLLVSGAVGELPDEAGRMADIAWTNTERLAHLLNDVLDLERFTAGKESLARREVELAVVVDRAVRAAEALASTKDVRVRVEVPDLTVWVDDGRMVQVLTNLLGNAIKFSEAGQTVEVSAGASAADVHLSVVDHGRGIPAEHLESIFERFVQVESADSHDKGGTGLGLAIAKHIVESHGGNISVESQPGRGSTFTIHLPRDDQ